MKIGLSLALLFGLVTCEPRKTPPPANVISAPALKAASSEQQSKASAAVEAATSANLVNPDGAPKTATAGELSVASANLPPPEDKDRIEALARVNLALKGDLLSANAEWAKARDAGAALSARVAQLELQVETERKQAAIELQRRIQAIQDEARAKTRQTQTYIFFGGGALLIAAAAAILFLGASVPMFGPKAAIAVGGAGLALILVGTLLNAINNFIEQHPYIFWGTLVMAAAGCVAAGALMFANHQHAKEKP